MKVEKGARLTRPAVSGDTSIVVTWWWAMSACRVGVCRRADTSRSACWVGTCQRADPNPVGRPTPFLSACRHPKASPPRVPREPDDCSQKVARAIYRLRRTDRTTRLESIERPLPCRYIDMRQRYVRWRGIRQAGSRWAGADQSIDARCSMDGSTLLNGWTRVRQWIAQRDSMDRTARLNGWDKTVQWIDDHPSISRGKTDKQRGRTKRA